VAVVLTLVQTKQIRINIHKRNNTKKNSAKIQNTVNTSTRITSTPTQLSKHPHITKPTHTHTHTLKNPTYTHTHTHYTQPHRKREIKSGEECLAMSFINCALRRIDLGDR